jgi:glycosyltransferase involved in cell wall biosynthesis
MASDFYAPFIGGAERQTQLLARSFARLGHEVHVVTTWHRGLAPEEDDDGVVVHRRKALSTSVPWFSSDPRHRYLPPIPDPRMAWAIRRLIRVLGPDLVHSWGWISYSAAAAVMGTGIPLLVSVRDYGFTCPRRDMLYRGRECSGPALRKCLGCAARHYGAAKGVAAVAGVQLGRPLLTRSVAAVHSITSFVQRVTRRDLLGERETTGLQTATIPDFVVPSFLDTLPPSEYGFLELLPPDPFILFVGALQRHKGVYELMEAYAGLRDAPPMVMIGSAWPDTPTAYPPGVTVHHNVRHEAVMAAWERCLFGVVPSRWPEPLGVVSLEAMSKGKAVVATATGGITDIVADGETGILVPVGDVPALRDAMQRLVDDPTLRMRLGAAGRERVEAFTADAVLPRYEAIYRSLIDGRDDGTRRAA